MLTSTFPSDWKKAEITPVHKAGDKSEVSNNSPISKIFERSVHYQLYKYPETKITN